MKQVTILILLMMSFCNPVAQAGGIFTPQGARNTAKKFAEIDVAAEKCKNISLKRPKVMLTLRQIWINKFGNIYVDTYIKTRKQTEKDIAAKPISTCVAALAMYGKNGFSIQNMLVAVPE